MLAHLCVKQTRNNRKLYPEFAEPAALAKNRTWSSFRRQSKVQASNHQRRRRHKRCPLAYARRGNQRRRHRWPPQSRPCLVLAAPLQCETDTDLCNHRLGNGSVSRAGLDQNPAPACQFSQDYNAKSRECREKKRGARKRSLRTSQAARDRNTEQMLVPWVHTRKPLFGFLA